jgi:nitronate monooxygenase
VTSGKTIAERIRFVWPDSRLIKLLKIEHPIILAPMADAMDADLVVEVSEAGGLGSLPCAMLTPELLRDQFSNIRARTEKPVNINFFCHTPPLLDNAREARWRDRLKPFYQELGIDPPVQSSNRAPFDAAFCDVVEDLRPQVVSFHFGLPAADLLRRVKTAGCVVISLATTAAEAAWLEQRGADAVIAQGYEAGGHRGMFLTDDIAAQVGTFALVPQIVDVVKVPVIAAGGIGDARGISAAFALGASGVQIGSGYLHCPEAKISAPHRAALKSVHDDGTVITNLMTGRPARGVYNRVMREMGPVSDVGPEFPLAAGALAPLRAKAEALGSGISPRCGAGRLRHSAVRCQRAN